MAVATGATCKTGNVSACLGKGERIHLAVIEIRVQRSRTINSVRLVTLFRVHMAVPGKQLYVCTTLAVHIYPIQVPTAAFPTTCSPTPGAKLPLHA